MTDHLAKLEALIEARKNATQGSWVINTLSGKPYNEVFTGQILIADTTGQHHIPQYGVRESENNALFIALAANFTAEHAQGLVEYVRGLEDKLRSLGELCEDEGCPHYGTKHSHPTISEIIKCHRAREAIGGKG